VLASGDRYKVTGSRQVAIGENVIVIVPPKSTHVFFRKNQIVGVEVEEPAV
jgi:mannose-6-phosphate isomerase-like protein (cupin superfamily)